MPYPTTRDIKIKINGVDRTSSIPVNGMIGDRRIGPPLTIVDRLTSQVNTALFVVENGVALSLSVVQEVIISNEAEDTRYFAGVITRLEPVERGVEIDYIIECDDYSWYMERPAVLVNEIYVSQSDQAIIQDSAMTTAMPEIEVATHVAQIDADTGLQHYIRETPRRIIEKLALDGGAWWYVDYGPTGGSEKAYLYYFAAGANAAPFNLSNTPDMSTTFPLDDFRGPVEAPEANRVVVVGKFQTVVRTRGAEGDYGRWLTAKVVDDTFLELAQLQAKGDQFLADAAESPTYEMTVLEPGLRAGMSIDLTYSPLSISASTQLITEVTTRWGTGGYAEFDLRMGKLDPSFIDIVSSSKNVRDTEQYVAKHAGEFEQESSDDGAQGALHNLISYNTNTGLASAIRLLKSHTAVVGTKVTTVDTEELGWIEFLGVREDAVAWAEGALIVVKQSGAAVAGQQNVPTVLDVYVRGPNTGDFVQFTLDGPNVRAKLLGQMHVEQDDPAAAVPVLILDQADVDEPFLKVIGESADGDLTRSLVEEGDQASETRVGWTMIEVEDSGGQIGSGKYHWPFYSLSA